MLLQLLFYYDVLLTDSQTVGTGRLFDEVWSLA
jgi:hypothetical protein